MPQQRETYPVLIGIAGPSGAGKTTVSERFIKASRRFGHVRLDDYFKSQKFFSKKAGYVNWEKPANFNFKKLYSDLKKLKAAASHKKYIFVEGFLLFKYPKIRKLLDYKVYFDLPQRLVIKRRRKRLGTNELAQYDRMVTLPEFKKYGVMQKKYANAIVRTDRPIYTVIKRVKKLLTDYVHQ
ncbi:MAG: hypothetical protein V4526_01105 [Patescibacteria group bacterium]